MDENLWLYQQEVLSRDERINRATDYYVDDIVVQEDVATAEEVVEHLKRFGLETKEPENLADNRIFGLKLQTDRNGILGFCRGKEVPEVDMTKPVTRRQLFSFCGKLTLSSGRLVEGGLQLLKEELRWAIPGGPNWCSGS